MGDGVWFMAVVFASIGDKIGVNFVRYKCYRSVVMEDVDVGGMIVVVVGWHAHNDVVLAVTRQRQGDMKVLRAQICWDRV